MKIFSKTLASVTIATAIFSGIPFMLKAELFRNLFIKEVVPENMGILVSYDLGVCPETHPLLIKISNNSSRDATDIRAVAFVREEGNSIPYCAELINFGGQIIKSGESHVSCLNTTDSRGGIIYDGRRVPDEILDRYDELGPAQFYYLYGAEWGTELQGFLAVSNQRKYDTGLSSVPESNFGCRKVSNQSAWRGKINYVEEFSGD